MNATGLLVFWDTVDAVNMKPEITAIRLLELSTNVALANVMKHESRKEANKMTKLC